MQPGEHRRHQDQEAKDSGAKDKEEEEFFDYLRLLKLLEEEKDRTEDSTVEVNEDSPEEDRERREDSAQAPSRPRHPIR